METIVAFNHNETAASVARRRGYCFVLTVYMRDGVLHYSKASYIGRRARYRSPPHSPGLYRIIVTPKEINDADHTSGYT
jgi:hypothetical protein